MSSTNTALADEIPALLTCRPDLVADRFALYRRLHREGPVLDLGTMLVLSRYADVESTFLRSDTVEMGGANLESSDLRAQYDLLPPEQQRKMAEFWGFRAQWVSATNGETHTRLRALAHRSFTPRVVRGMTARVQEVTAALLDEAAAEAGPDGVVDLIARFAWILPLTVVSELLDVPTDERDRIRRWSVDVAGFSGAGGYGAALDQAYPSLFALKSHLGAIFAARRGASTTDLMAALVNAETDDGARFTEDELVGMIAQLIWAGHETTTNLIGNGLFALLSDRDQWDALCGDPSLVPGAVEESLRYYSPTQVTKRMATRDTVVAGVEVPAMRSVVLLLGAAHRDPARYPEPDVFDLTRGAGTRHLAFGLGPHFCLGAALARMEGAAALAAIATRFPDVRLASTTPAWSANSTFLGLSALPVVLGRDRG